VEKEGPAPIITAMVALEAQTPEANLVDLAKAHDYFVRHAAQMDYPRYRALGLPIGSGIVEGARETLVNERLDGDGMRWWSEKPGLKRWASYVLCIVRPGPVASLLGRGPLSDPADGLSNEVRIAGRLA